MSDTPEPCGCKVRWAYSDTHPPVIHYCSTHAAAPRRLAALREVVDKCEMAASLAVIKRVALDAIAQVKGEGE